MRNDGYMNIADYLDKLDPEVSHEIYTYFVHPLVKIFMANEATRDLEIGGVKFNRNDISRGKFEVLTNADSIENWDIEHMVEDLYELCEKNGLLTELENKNA